MAKGLSELFQHDHLHLCLFSIMNKKNVECKPFLETTLEFSKYFVEVRVKQDITGPFIDFT